MSFSLQFPSMCECIKLTVFDWWASCMSSLNPDRAQLDFYILLFISVRVSSGQCGMQNGLLSSCSVAKSKIYCGPPLGCCLEIHCAELTRWRVYRVWFCGQWGCVSSSYWMSVFSICVSEIFLCVSVWVCVCVSMMSVVSSCMFVCVCLSDSWMCVSMSQT